MNNRTKVFLSSGFFILTAWLAFIYINYTDFQNLRHTDIFWVLDVINPYFYIIILALAIILGASIWSYTDEKWVHVVLLSIFGIILLCTPYFITGLARFPDTFGVVSSVENLPQLLSGSTSYAANYPLSYVLFYSVSEILQIDLFVFSRFIFSPLVIVSFLIIWYLFVCRFFSPRIAYLSTFLAMPVMLIEISITPNSVAVVLVLSALLLVSLNSLKGQFLTILLALALVLVHPINIIILAAIFISFRLVELLLGRPKNIGKMGISTTLILLIAVAWFGWSLYISPMGSSVIDSIVNVFTMDSRYSQQFLEYSVGSGNLAYAWIQQLTQASYLIICLLGVFFIICTTKQAISDRIHSPSHMKKINSMNYKLFTILLTTGMIFIIACCSILFITDGQGILSRSLNISMLFLSAYISAASIIIMSTLSKKKRQRLAKCLCASIIAAFLILVIIYPLHGYARESYVSYPDSFGAGREFNGYFTNSTQQAKIALTENDLYQAQMSGGSAYDAYINRGETALWSSTSEKIYSNAYYSIFLQSKQKSMN